MWWDDPAKRDDWLEFFLEQRIGHQLRMAGDVTLRDEWGKVCQATGDLRSLFEGVEVRPSVLHGDLWSGNVAAVEGEPCIFDPASYYGHHEASIWMDRSIDRCMHGCMHAWVHACMGACMHG